MIATEPNLHAKHPANGHGNIVIDQEVVTRTFPEGTGRIIATYLVQQGQIAKAWFIFGAKTLDAEDACRAVPSTRTAKSRGVIRVRVK